MHHWMDWAHSSHLQGWDSDITGYLASALVLTTFCMKSMRALRLTAICSNVAFITYALATDMRPILILHCILLPVNALRLGQMELEKRRQSRERCSSSSCHADGLEGGRPTYAAR